MSSTSTLGGLELDERPRFEERFQAIGAAFAERRPLDGIRGIRAALQLSLEPGELRQLAMAMPALGKDVVPWRRYLRIAVLPSTTLRDQLALLRMHLAADMIGGEFLEGPFDQIAQQIEDPGSELNRFAPQLVILAPSFRDVELGGDLDAEVQRWAALSRQVQDRHGAMVIQHGFLVPHDGAFGNLGLGHERAPGRFLRKLNLELATHAGPSFALLDVDAIAAGFGKERWTDPRYWCLAKEEVSSAARPGLARAQAAMVRAMVGLSKKAIVVDLDNTLWGGVVGEDGVANLELGGTPRGEAFVAFQRHLARLRARGVLLAIASKNNEPDAMRALQEHPEMVLRPADFAAVQIHWESKSKSLIAIAQELEVGLDSLVFVDDNPLERAEVRAACPDVEVVCMPEDPSYYVRALDRERWFEAAILSEEDFGRATDHSASRQRRIIEASASSLDDFLRELDMQAVVKPFDEANLPRVVQLFHRTNQYNLTTRRYSEADVRGMMSSPGVHTRWLRLGDRLGDRGLVAVVIARENDRALEIDSWLMSCRVLNRTVEHLLLTTLVELARERELTRIVGTYLPTPKNSPARDHYAKLGFDLVEELPDGSSRWERPIARELPGSFVALDNGET